MRRSQISWLSILAPLVLVIACGGGASEDDEWAERMAQEHAGDTSAAGPGAEVEPAGEVSTGDVVYGTLDGVELPGYLAAPVAGGQGAPGVVLIHEWWGLNDNIRAMARRLAGEGYVVLAADMYGGATADQPDRARELMQAANEDAASARDNLRLAVEHLRDEQGASRVGVMGWCFGGGWALRAATFLGDGIDAAVIYYGSTITDRDRLEKITAPLLGHFGERDSGIPVETVREMEDMLEQLGVDATFHYYDAGHAFANPSGQNWEPDAAETAWRRTLEFLAEELKGAHPES